MDLSSLSKYPWPKGQPPLDAIKAGDTFSPRVVRILRDLTLLLAIVVLLCGLRPIVAAIKKERQRPAPLSFPSSRSDLFPLP